MYIYIYYVFYLVILLLDHQGKHVQKHLQWKDKVHSFFWTNYGFRHCAYLFFRGGSQLVRVFFRSVDFSVNSYFEEIVRVLQPLR